MIYVSYLRMYAVKTSKYIINWFYWFFKGGLLCAKDC